MAKNKKKAEETHTSIDTLNDSLTSLPTKLKESRKIITVASIVVIVIVAAILFYLFGIRQPGISKANENIGLADRELIVNGNDSLALNLYLKTAENGYDAGNRARLQAAIILYNQAKYEEALNAVKDYSANDAIIGAAAYSLKGDCYVMLDKLPDAVSAFKDAIDQSDDNTYYTPIFMMKLARVYEAQKNYAEAEKLYQQIIDDFPVYSHDINTSIEKHLERAKLMQQK